MLECLFYSMWGHLFVLSCPAIICTSYINIHILYICITPSHQNIRESFNYKKSSAIHRKHKMKIKIKIKTKITSDGKQILRNAIWS